MEFVVELGNPRNFKARQQINQTSNVLLVTHEAM
jgi:hypothetical protein